MNSYLYYGEGKLARDHVTFEKVCFDLSRIMDGTNASFLLLPFGNGFPHNDRLANSVLYSKCKFWKKNIICYEQLDVQETLDVVSAANILIGTRLHASIFACIGGTPFIDLTHHNKTSLFLESVGKKEWGINYWNLNVERLKSLIEEFLSENKHRADLLNIAENNKDILQNLTDLLIWD